MSKKIFTSLGLMSGTSMDGVDASIIQSDGITEFELISNEYCEFDQDLFQKLIELRDKLFSSKDLDQNLKHINEIEINFTLFISKFVNSLIEKNSLTFDLIGFHGQTILHLPKEKISKQLGDGNLLSQLTKTKVVYQFRQNDLDHGGQGAPLTPIFHFLISGILKKKFNLDFPMSIINIGGITNVSQIKISRYENKNLFAYDIAPGNCLIDEWVRKNSNKKFDLNGDIASSGKVNSLLLNQIIDNFNIKDLNNSLDIKNFDISFVRGLCLEDGCATITKYTAYLISEGLKKIDEINKLNTLNFYLCGGGRKNKTLIKNINEYLGNQRITLKNIDDYEFDGDFIESQAFAYLAIRSYLGLPISYPNTTRTLRPISGGIVGKNY
jgi:anhydro-N-acetylmuramic acid kinase